MRGSVCAMGYTTASTRHVNAVLTSVARVMSMQCRTASANREASEAVGQSGSTSSGRVFARQPTKVGTPARISSTASCTQSCPATCRGVPPSEV
jgi:hypothetical protein